MFTVLTAIVVISIPQTSIIRSYENPSLELTGTPAENTEKISKILTSPLIVASAVTAVSVTAAVGCLGVGIIATGISLGMIGFTNLDTLLLFDTIATVSFGTSLIAMDIGLFFGAGVVKLAGDKLILTKISEKLKRIE